MNCCKRQRRNQMNDPFVAFTIVMAIATGLLLVGAAIGGSFTGAIKLWLIWGLITLCYCWLGSGKPPWRW